MPPKKTKEQFVKEANEVHQNKCDYTDSDYVNNITKMKILCKEHNVIFEQTPKKHLIGQTSCKQCIEIKCPIITTEIFVERSNKIHNNEYDYSLTQYINTETEVTIICKIHGPFTCRASSHSQGTGCGKCYGIYQSNTEEFVKKATEIHGNKFDYSKVEYKKCYELVCIICRIHGEFMQSPSNHLKGHQCPECSSIQYTTESFIQKAKEKHGDIYDYSKVVYVNIETPVIIICKQHGEFQTTPKTHLKGSICKKCVLQKQSEERSFTLEQFIERANETHKNKYSYDNANYTNSKRKVNITCKKHGDFLQIPNQHIQGDGCPKCSKKGYSQISIRWLTFISQLYGIKIQHAENEGEFSIPDTRMKADGYCKDNNTIYEFHGTLWHGDPRVYKPDEMSHIGITFGELYQKTLRREKRIRDLGYNYVIIWEKDWKNLLKSVKKIQQKFRKNK
jgi:hypothetical protein